MARALTILFSAALVWLLAMPTAFAAKNDLTLWRMCVRDSNGWCQPELSNTTRVMPDNDKFARFTEQFAASLAPRYHAPADTLGWYGWNLGFEYAFNDIPGGEQWDDALVGVERFANLDADNKKARSAPGLLHTVQFHARKGLPFSTELGFDVLYLINSKMYQLGVEGKFAFLEGFKELYIPDMAVRMNYSHLFGSADMELDTYAWDLSISKTFPVGGFISFAPYVAYSLVYSVAAPYALNPSFDSGNNGRLLMLDTQYHVIHRGVFGLRMLTMYLNLTPEITVTSVSVYSYSIHLGAEW
jgi:hypothetical protein